AAAAARGSSAPKSTITALGALAKTRRVKPALSGRVSAVSASTMSAGRSDSRSITSGSETAVRTAPAIPSRIAAAATLCAAVVVRTHTRTERTVIPLSSQEKTTEGPDHYALSRETRGKLDRKSVV